MGYWLEQVSQYFYDYFTSLLPEAMCERPWIVDASRNDFTPSMVLNILVNDECKLNMLLTGMQSVDIIWLHKGPRIINIWRRKETLFAQC